MTGLDRAKIELADIAHERRRALINANHWQNQLAQLDQAEALAVEKVEQEKRKLAEAEQSSGQAEGI